MISSPLMPFRLLSIVAAALVATGSIPTQSKADRPDARCTIALGYVKEMVARADGHRLVFTTDPPDVSQVSNRGWFEAGADGPGEARIRPPSADLLERLRRDAGNAVGRCAAVREFLRARAIAYGPGLVNATGGQVVFNASVESVSMPAVSKDGRHAIVARADVRGLLIAASWLELLERKSNGRWRVIGFHPITVS